MGILNLYLFKRFMYGCVLSLVVLLSIATFLSLTGELEDLNTGNYTFRVFGSFLCLFVTGHRSNQDRHGQNRA